jgi:hypothetical protein
MRCSTIIAVSITVSLACTGCIATQSNPLKASFRLTNQATTKPLTNVVVTVFDGFDKNLPPFAGPVRSDNEPYYFADITTSTNGTLDLDLNQLKEDTVLITAGELYKYIRHQGNLVTVIHYNREGNSLHVSAHYNYDLKTKLVTVIRFPEKRAEQAKVFSIIDAPMD